LELKTVKTKQNNLVIIKILVIYQAKKSLPTIK